MILFIILKLTGCLTISWWWILVSPFSFLIPGGTTGLFTLIKCLGVLNLSWWWIILAIIIDFAELICTLINNK